MGNHFHALVWIDHREAKIFRFNATESEHATISSTHPDQHLHHKANSGDSGHAPVDKEYLRHVTASLADAGAILITGPAGAKKELAGYIEQNAPALAQKISAVETLDHPNDGLLLAHGRKFFRADDRMHGRTSA
ncbi:MAG: translational machinery protein [Pseudomonadota bacterium]